MHLQWRWNFIFFSYLYIHGNLSIKTTLYTQIIFFMLKPLRYWLNVRSHLSFFCSILSRGSLRKEFLIFTPKKGKWETKNTQRERILVYNWFFFCYTLLGKPNITLITKCIWYIWLRASLRMQWNFFVTKLI